MADEAISRRTFVKRTGGFIALATAGPGFLAACRHGDEGEGNGAKKGGTFISAIPRDIITLDPHRNTLAVFRANIRSAVFDALTFVAPDLSVQPRLAESWETSSDGRTVTFNLRKGVKFHDGSDFTAKDVAFTFNRILDPEIASPMTPYVETVTRADVIDDHTLRVRLSQPSPYFVPLLNWVQIVGEGSIGSIETEPVGTGPFAFAKWVPNDRITMTRNDNYWQGAPNVDEIVLRIMPDPQARLAGLQTSSVHMVDPIEAKDISEVEGFPDATVFSTPPTMRYENFHLNTSRKPLDDKRVRQALSYALDRDSYVEKFWFGKARRGVTPFVEEMPTYLPGADERYPFDPERADALLTEAGAKPLKAEILNIEGHETGRAMALLLQENLNKMGNALTVRDLESAAWVERVVTKPDYDITTDFFVTIPEDPHGMFTSENLKTPENINQWSPPEFVDLRARAASELNDARRVELYQELQELLLEEVPMIVASHIPLLIAYKEGVEGPVIGPSDFRDWSGVAIS